MSPQECKIDQCAPNQIEMRAITLALAQKPSRKPHHTQQVA